jgi:uncharacterized protein (DUF58 family)
MTSTPEVGDERPAGASARALLRSARAGLGRVLAWFPWTPLGLLLTVGAYLALERFARAQLDLVWLVVAYVGLGLAALTPLSVLSAAAWLKLRHRADALHDPLVLETGTWADTGFSLPSPWYLPLVQLRCRWAAPRAVRVELRREHGRLIERVSAGDRGRFARVDRRVAIADPFGLCRVEVRIGQERAVDVLPRLGGLRHLPALSALASGDSMPHPMGLEDGDRLELRRYTAGDPVRFVHWKVLSRTRKLMVRTPERALSVARRMAAFAIAGDDDDASAAVARLALERKLLGGEWLFGTDDRPAGTDRVPEALDALMRSSEARARAGSGLSAFVQHAERSGPASLVVFAPSRDGDWVERVAAVARRRRLRVVIGTDGMYERARPSVWLRALSSWSAPEGTPAAELEGVLRVLSQAGAEVVVLDRGSGRALGTSDRRAFSRLAVSGAWGVR